MKKNTYILFLIIIILSSCEKEHGLYDSPIIEENIDIVDYSDDFICFSFNGTEHKYKRFGASKNNGFLVWELSQDDLYVERELSASNSAFNLNITFPSNLVDISNSDNYMKYYVHNYEPTETKEDNNSNGKFEVCFQIRDANSILYRSIESNDLDNFYNKITSIELLKVYDDEAFFSVKGEFAIKLKSVNTSQMLEKEIHNGRFSVVVSAKTN